MNNMKMRFKRWMCRLFGHSYHEEVLVEGTTRYSEIFIGGKLHCSPLDKEPIYTVVREFRCARCGKEHREVLREGIRLSQLLEEGWFIEQQ